MSIFSKLTDLGRELAATTRSAQDTIATVREQITAKRKELAHAERAPLPREEIQARIREWVTETGESWRQRHAGRLVDEFGNPTAKGAPPWTPLESMTWGTACCYLGPQLTAALTAAVDATEYTPGPSSAERPRVIERLSRELADLEASEERAIDEAAAAGVQIQHRPEVVQRRQQEEGRRKRQDEWTAGVRERQAVVDQRAPTRRIGGSEYLDSMRRRDS